jgi:hypothetical protein
MTRLSIVCALAAAALVSAPMAPAAAQIRLTAAPQEQAAKPDEKKLTPEEKMNSRFPQPVRVGDLIGLPVLDAHDSTLGTILAVARTPAGKIVLVVNYRGWLAWAPLDWGRRRVGVPLETVAILARQVAALDFSREDFDAAPPFAAAHGTPLGVDDMIKIAITRR